jgi:hypothetical protein
MTKFDYESFAKIFEIQNNRNTVDAALKSFFKPNSLEKFMKTIVPPADDGDVQVALAVSIARAEKLRKNEDVVDYFYPTVRSLARRKAVGGSQPESFNHFPIYMMLEGFSPTLT